MHLAVGRSFDKTLKRVVEHLIEHHFLEAVEHIDRNRASVRAPCVDYSLDSGSLLRRDAPNLPEKALHAKKHCSGRTTKHDLSSVGPRSAKTAMVRTVVRANGEYMVPGAARSTRDP